MVKQKHRLDRQFDAIGRKVPLTRRVIDPLLRGRLRRVRVPIAVLLILGGIFSILPVLGLWMLPLGLLLLAVDVPALQPAVSSLIIRARRAAARWRRNRS